MNSLSKSGLVHWFPTTARHAPLTPKVDPRCSNKQNLEAGDHPDAPYAPGENRDSLPELFVEFNRKMSNATTLKRDANSGNDADLSNTGSYRSVAFAYGNPDESTEQKSNDAEPAFCPAFPVPESLIQNLMLGAGMQFLLPRFCAGGIRIVETC
ncbi:hypothetical protein M0R45_026507 [Rubus argutus]|uniref:Uncharacterized protein n=1 Tax=Rubus argutus TaxID=59490 RepID=A0AAW1WXB3_RUBAR